MEFKLSTSTVRGAGVGRSEIYLVEFKHDWRVVEIRLVRTSEIYLVEFKLVSSPLVKKISRNVRNLPCGI